MTRSSTARSIAGKRRSPGTAPEAATDRPSLMDDSPRGRILRAAAHLFVTQGYAQTTVRDLARAVGILSGSLFHHFASKEEILEAVMAEVSVLTTERMRTAAASSSKPLERVRALIRAELDSLHGETSEAMTLLVNEWRSLSPEAQQRVLVVRDRYQEVWKEAMAGARAELVSIDPVVLRRLIYGMTSYTATWYRTRGPISLDALTDHVLSLVSRRKGRHG
jgi:AcrR family transcriptional regulator